MREYFRPYNKIITITDADPHTVELTDSAGAKLECNYVSVTSVSGTEGDYFQVIPSGVNTIYGPAGGGTLSGRDLGPSAYPDASARTSNNASGVLGLVAGAEAGTAILSLAPQDSTNAVIISMRTAPGNSNTLGVTYGQVRLANQMADNYKGAYEVTWEETIASFTSSVDAVASSVALTDTSKGNPYAYAWEFSATGAVAGSTPIGSTAPNPTHVYDSAGTFNIRLGVSSLHGTSDASGSITIA